MSNTIRLIIATTAAQAPALNTWWRNNIDPTGGDTFTVALQLTTDPPETIRAYWAGVSVTVAEVKTIVQKLCQLASITFPADWDTKTLAQRKSWFNTNKAVLLSAGKVRIRFCGIDEAWDNPDELLAEAGYKRVEVPI